jgi:type VI secretion system protein ImpM
MGFGLFGKLPQKRDFLSIGLSSAVLHPLENWLQSAVAASRNDIGRQWQDYYLVAPVWRFWLGPEIVGTACAGALMPSVDQVGRYFPLTIVYVAGPGEALPPPYLDPADRWYQMIEARLLSVLSMHDQADVTNLLGGLLAPTDPVFAAPPEPEPDVAADVRASAHPAAEDLPPVDDAAAWPPASQIGGEAAAPAREPEAASASGAPDKSARETGSVVPVTEPPPASTWDLPAPEQGEQSAPGGDTEDHCEPDSTDAEPQAGGEGADPPSVDEALEPDPVPAEDAPALASIDWSAPIASAPAGKAEPESGASAIGPTRPVEAGEVLAAAPPAPVAIEADPIATNHDEPPAARAAVATRPPLPPRPRISVSEFKRGVVAAIEPGAGMADVLDELRDADLRSAATTRSYWWCPATASGPALAYSGQGWPDPYFFSRMLMWDGHSRS